MRGYDLKKTFVRSDDLIMNEIYSVWFTEKLVYSIGTCPSLITKDSIRSRVIVQNHYQRSIKLKRVNFIPMYKHFCESLHL